MYQYSFSSFKDNIKVFNLDKGIITFLAVDPLRMLIEGKELHL